MPPPPKTSRRALWWLLHGERLRAAGGLGLGVAVIAGFALLVAWSRGGGTVTGQVVRFGLRETDLGSVPVAVVQLADRLTTVELARTHNCRIGDSITIHRRRQGVLGGYSRPCTPAPTN